MRIGYSVDKTMSSSAPSSACLREAVKEDEPTRPASDTFVGKFGHTCSDVRIPSRSPGESAKEPHEGCGLLCAGDLKSVVDDERRNGGDVALLAPLQIGSDGERERVGRMVGRDEVTQVLGDETCSGRTFHQRWYLRDIPTLREVGLHDRLVHSQLEVWLGRLDELEQTVRGCRVRTNCLVHGERDSGFSCDASDVSDDPVGGRLASESACIGIPNRLGAPEGSRRIELKGTKVDVDGCRWILAPEYRQGCIEVSFADVAPRANEVRHDFQEHCCHDRGMNSADITATFCATLVDEWVALGVRRAVTAPGSRSTPMALALAANPALTVEVFHDERSASFAALGMAKASRIPTILLCTSGTAAANFHPAVVEASHAEVPLIVVTADRPPELQGIGAAQTIDQKHLYGSVVRSFVDAGVPDDDERAGWRRNARRLHAMATGDRPGPVHINLPFREPLLGVVGCLPERGDEVRRRNRKPVGTETLSRLVARLGNRRGVIIAGANGPTSDRLSALARRLNWPVLADPLGGSRGESGLAVRHADAWLREPALAARFVPEVVLRFGSVPASKVVNSWLRESSAELIVVSDSPFLIDPDRRSSMHVIADPDALCADLSSIVTPVDPSWSTMWEASEKSARVAISGLLDDETRLSEPGAARTTVRNLPEGAALVVSSSMPIRDVEWYSASCAHVTVLANRGVNGIDGVVSTAVGVALAHGGPTGLLIGDVAFLHDSNGLIGLMDRDADVRIVVVDNQGGGIFSFLPQRASLGFERFEQLFGTPHTSDIAKLAGAHGVPAVSVVSTHDLAEALALPGPRVIVVRSDRQENVAVHDAIHTAVQRAIR